VRFGKALVHEQFGDGIISAINFKLDVQKVADPEAASAPSSASTAGTCPRSPSEEDISACPQRYLDLPA